MFELLRGFENGLKMLVFIGLGGLKRLPLKAGEGKLTDCGI